MADQVDILNYITYQNHALLASWTDGDGPQDLPDLLQRPKSDPDLNKKKFASPEEVKAFLALRR